MKLLFFVRHTMRTLDDIAKDSELVSEIDWEVTHEQAIASYLEWGNSLAGGRAVRSGTESSTYFVLDTWNEPKINLVRMDNYGRHDLARIELPDHLKDEADRPKGIYAVDGRIREWLMYELGA